jgi:hypothetical protein
MWSYHIHCLLLTNFQECAHLLGNITLPDDFPNPFHLFLYHHGFSTDPFTKTNIVTTRVLDKQIRMTIQVSRRRIMM